MKTQPDRVQREVLEPKRYALWQAGTLRLTQFTDQQHRPLTLDELAAARQARE
jgi:hypothetical protein